MEISPHKGANTKRSTSGIRQGLRNEGTKRHDGKVGQLQARVYAIAKKAVDQAMRLQRPPPLGAKGQQIHVAFTGGGRSRREDPRRHPRRPGGQGRQRETLIHEVEERRQHMGA